MNKKSYFEVLRFQTMNMFTLSHSLKCKNRGIRQLDFEARVHFCHSNNFNLKIQKQFRKTVLAQTLMLNKYYTSGICFFVKSLNNPLDYHI